MGENPFLDETNSQMRIRNYLSSIVFVDRNKTENKRVDKACTDDGQRRAKILHDAARFANEGEGNTEGRNVTEYKWNSANTIREDFLLRRVDSLVLRHYIQVCPGILHSLCIRQVK